MNIGLIIFLFILWNAVGSIFCALWCYAINPKGWELCNPYWAYRYYKRVNWFGVTLLSLLFTALCPIGAACYWLYKLCTVGRR